MKDYNINFEIYGKKMKTTVKAKDIPEAKDNIRNKIIFHKVVEKKDTDFENIKSMMNEIIDILGGNKK